MDLIQKFKKYFQNLKNLRESVLLACPPKFCVAKLRWAYPVPKRSLWFGVFLFFIIFGLFFPLFSSAQWEAFFPILSPSLSWGLGLVRGGLGLAGGIASAIAGAIVLMIMALLYSLSLVLLEFARAVLSWATDPFFLISSYTKGGVVDVGWPVVRDLANMLIVLALIFIGLGTALRLQEYQARRTLPLLIIIALLINFTPVILGVIVDGANITMNFFLSGLSGTEALVDRFKSLGATIVNSLSNIASFDPIGNWPLAFEITIMAAYNVFAAIIFLLFALLFIIRRVAIWILVILSPLAFVAYILPATRGFFNFWWHQFWQWTIIGVFAAFFLWLGDHMISIASEEQGQGFLNEVLPFGVALILLLIGFFVALSTSAMGATGIVAGGQKFGKAVAPWAGRKAWERGKTYAKEKWQKSEKAGKISERLALAKAPEEVRILGKKIPIISPVARWGAATSVAAGQAIGRAGQAAREIGPADVDKEVGEAKKRDAVTNLSSFRSPQKTKTQRASALIGAYEAGQGKQLEKLGIEESEIEKWQREAMEIHPQVFKRAAIAYPKNEILERVLAGFSEERRLAAGDLTDDDRQKGYRNIGEKIIAEAKPEEIAKMAPSILKDKDVEEAIHTFWGGPQISAAARTFGRDFVDSFVKEMKRRGVQWYKEDNPKVLRYTSRTTARELGFLHEDEIGPGTEEVPRRQPPPGPPPPEAPPPSRRPRRPRVRPGPGVEEASGEVPPKETVEQLREEIRRRGPRARPGPGV